jgi:hypothetical protein
MTTPDIVADTKNPVANTPWYKSKKLWIAVPLALVLIGMNAVIFRPASAIAGMLTDSCSGDSNAYLMWDVWLNYLWPVVMLICSLLPAYLVIKNKSWWKVVLGILAGGVVSVIWYFLWAPVLWITGC